MNDTLPAEPLTLEHRQIDAGILGVIDGSGSIEAMAASLEMLRRHIHVEETIVFPPLEETLAMPLLVMKREHGLMWPLLLKLIDGCENGTPAEELQGTAKALLQLLQMHNTKEEEVIYAAADRHASERGDNALMQAIGNADTPQEWYCAAAPH